MAPGRTRLRPEVQHHPAPLRARKTSCRAKAGLCTLELPRENQPLSGGLLLPPPEQQRGSEAPPVCPLLPQLHLSPVALVWLRGPRPACLLFKFQKHPGEGAYVHFTRVHRLRFHTSPFALGDTLQRRPGAGLLELKLHR